MQSLFWLKHLAHLSTYVHLCLKGNRHSGRDPVAVSVPPLWVRFIELQMPSCPLTRHIPSCGVATIAMPDDTMWSNVQSVICIKNHYRKLSHFRLAEQFAVCKTQWICKTYWTHSPTQRSIRCFRKHTKTAIQSLFSHTNTHQCSDPIAVFAHTPTQRSNRWFF